ncbi:hypothetical protein [Sorangium sp. So ce381]|uniref:hypothetical protein n=1 Tax=Sorangium sp. So ce381 TaxID=3133307 RepID=UPI003F5B8C36
MAYPETVGLEVGYNIGLPYEGFDFTMLGAQLTDRRLRFAIDPRELWKRWCELLASNPGSGSYKCMHNGGHGKKGPRAASRASGLSTADTSRCVKAAFAVVVSPDAPSMRATRSPSIFSSTSRGRTAASRSGAPFTTSG